MNRSPHDLAHMIQIPLTEIERIATLDSTSLYRYERRQIGMKKRLLRIPRPVLRPILDAVKKLILDPMPLPPTMHGWRKKHSPKTYAKAHLRRSMVLNIDIQDFFPTVTGAKVYAFWTRAGFTPEAANLLTRLTVSDNQLPQGSPTSQAIGNHVLVLMDRRLNRLAQKTGSRHGMYGDEFSISGRRRVERLKGLACRIVEQEGFNANPEKIKPLARSERQEITGIVVNRKPSPGRQEYRNLRAQIHNCLRYGPSSQNFTSHPNFRGHLLGRISQFQHVNPKLGDQLRSEFNKIHW